MWNRCVRYFGDTFAQFQAQANGEILARQRSEAFKKQKQDANAGEAKDDSTPPAAPAADALA